MIYPSKTKTIMAVSKEDSLQDVKSSLHLLSFPTEILEHIFASPSLDYADIYNVSLVCSKFHQVTRSNDLWRQKLRARWPHLHPRYDSQGTFNWFEEYKQRHLFGSDVHASVTAMSPRFYSLDEVSKEGFRGFEILMEQYGNGREYALDELLEILHDGKTGDNLTEKYYAGKVLRHVKHMVLTEKITAFFQQPVEKQSLEDAAILLAMWCQPTEDITEDLILARIDALTTLVKQEVFLKDPDHPALTREYNTEALTSDLWNVGQSTAVLLALNNVMYHNEGFRGNGTNYYEENNSYINKVLDTRTGIPITLSIVYSAVARRLGVLCEPVSYPSHFILRWKQHPMSNSESAYTYIDAFNKGCFMTQTQLPAQFSLPAGFVLTEHLLPVSTLEVMHRMIRNLLSIGRQQRHDGLLCLRNTLELAMVVVPNDFDMRMNLIRVNLHLNINIPDVISCLQNIADEDQNRMGLVAYLMTAAQSQQADNNIAARNRKVKVKTRKKKGAKFSVGLVMKHKRYGYNCVISGWDNICTASQEWILQMGVNMLPHKDRQPFYNVLADDGTSRYVAEENLSFQDAIGPIDHPDVGRYFCQFAGTHYIPNTQKAAEYPVDTERTIKQDKTVRVPEYMEHGDGDGVEDIDLEDEVELQEFV